MPKHGLQENDLMLYLRTLFSGCSVARSSRLLWEQEVAGSNPATPTKNQHQLGMWRSLVAHTHGVRGVAGSNPVIPTYFLKPVVVQVFLFEFLTITH